MMLERIAQGRVAWYRRLFHRPGILALLSLVYPVAATLVLAGGFQVADAWLRANEGLWAGTLCLGGLAMAVVASRRWLRTRKSLRRWWLPVAGVIAAVTTPFAIGITWFMLTFTFDFDIEPLTLSLWGC